MYILRSSKFAFAPGTHPGVVFTLYLLCLSTYDMISIKRDVFLISTLQYYIECGCRCVLLPPAFSKGLGIANSFIDLIPVTISNICHSWMRLMIPCPTTVVTTIF